MTQAVPATLAWLNGAAVGAVASAGAVAAGAAGRLAAAGGLPTVGRVAVPPWRGVAGAVLPCRVTGPRATNLVSREVWQPEPPQSWPA